MFDSFLINAIYAVNQAFWEAIYTLLARLCFFRSFCKQKQHFSTHSLSPSLALPFPPWVSTSSNPGSQDHAINGTLFSYTECLPFSFQRECLTIVLQVWQPVIHACRLEGTGRCSWYQKKYRDTTLGQKNPSLQRWRKEDFPKISQMVWKISNTGEANWKLKLIQFEFSQGRRVQTVGRLTSIRWGGCPSCLPIGTGVRELHNQLMDEKLSTGN